MHKQERIELKVPAVPHSLREFIENTVRDERAFRRMIESPVTALIEAGVPIREDSLTEEDGTRLVKVLANIRSYVKEENLPETLRFEDIFEVKEFKYLPPDVELPSELGNQQERDVELPSELAGGAGWIRNDKGIVSAPLLSPSDLTEIMVRMDERVKAHRELR